MSESFENSDIRIDNPGEESSFPNVNRPYTNKPTFCGSPGFYIHMTPEFVTNGDIADVYGGYNKVWYNIHTTVLYMDVLIVQTYVNKTQASIFVFLHLRC